MGHKNRAAHRGALIVLGPDRVVGERDMVQVPEGRVIELHIRARLRVVEVHDDGCGAGREEVRQRSQAPARRHQHAGAAQRRHLFTPA